MDRVFRSRFERAEAGDAPNIAFIREQYNEACAEQEKGPSGDEIIAMQIVPGANTTAPRQFVTTKYGRTFARCVYGNGETSVWEEVGTPVPGTLAREKFNEVREIAGDLLEAKLADASRSRR